jgi:thiosulfate/3-mercaptopyruvate sulfurtransferase
MHSVTKRIVRRLAITTWTVQYCNPMSTYVDPEALVDTEWVAAHLGDPGVRLVEVDVNTQAYDSGHLPTAIGWSLYQDLLRADNSIIDKMALEALLARSGIANTTMVVLYGHRNAPAAMAFWFLKAPGHDRLRLMNGGRQKWVDEGRPMTGEVTVIAPAAYAVQVPDWSLRACRDDVQAAIGSADHALVDVRTSAEYEGELFWPSAPPQTGERAGHIPGAVHIPFEMTLSEDGTFKSIGWLRALYEGKGITADKEVITYCTVGGRSCHTWFVLTHLLGYPNVREYAASWYEWGRLLGAPIEK